MDAPAATPVPPETVILQPGVGGLMLTPDQETLPADAATRFDDWQVVDRTRVQIRPGLTVGIVLPGATAVHSLGRLFQPATHEYLGVIGADTNIWRGTAAGGFSVVQSGLSGDPVTFVPFRPAQSGTPWMLGADRLGVGQVPPTGEILFLGLPAPAAAPTTAIADILRTTICSFDTADNAAAWTATTGIDRSTPPVAAGVPSVSDVPGLEGNCVQFQTTPGSAAKGYSSLFGLPRVMDLTQLQGGFRPSTEDDIVHLWIRIDRPGLVEEIRVFLVCASGFSPNVIPGQDEALNTDAFVKTFQPSEFTGFLEGLQSASEAAETSQATQVIRDYLTEVPSARSPEVEDNLGPSPAFDRGGTDVDPVTQLPQTFAPGRNTWTEFGAIGRPLRRSDFTRIGSTAGRGWDTITGIVIIVQTLTNQPVKVACDDWYLTGGYSLDASEPGAQAYDYRYTHYHLDTGDEGNPSPIQGEAGRLLPVRQRISVIPSIPYAGPGSARVRQRIYRRGGTVTDDWYYLGRNTANGGEFVDTLSDLEVVAAPTLEIDNYQPVPSLDATGTTVLAQPVPAIWGPVDGAIYGCGDALRPGHVYRSKTGRPGSWPPDLACEVCAPSEELLHGFSYGGQAFVASRLRIYALGTSASGQIVAQDTLCLKGFAGRWAYAVGERGCYFISDDGMYLFTGTGAPVQVSLAIAALWRGQTINGHAPINLSAETSLRLFLGKQVLYFCYLDTTGSRQTLALDLLTGGWGRHRYTPTVRSYYWDGENPELPGFFGSATDGIVYAQTGVSDAGTPITGVYHGPRVSVGRPREEKQLGDLTVRAGYVPAAAVSVVLQVDDVPLAPDVLPVGTALDDVRTTIDAGGGETEIRGRTFQPQITWVQPVDAARAGELRQIWLTTYALGEETYKRVGQWEPLGATGGYLTGVTITADTRVDMQPARDLSVVVDTRTVRVEYTRGSTGDTIGPFEIDCSEGRRTLHLSWPGVRADQVRLVPEDDNPWILYKLDWHAAAEPPVQTTWDSGDELLGDTYYTGLDLVLDTFSGSGQVACYVDGVLVYTALAVTAAGKHLVHVTLPPGYGHVYRFVLTGTSATVYSWQWITAPVPGEQTHWNRNFEIAGTLTDKWIKGVLLECDTGGLAKTIQLQVDGVIVRTFTVQHLGRQVAHISFPQVRGRVLRLQPTDTVASRLWTVQWIFDEEPLALTQWETQLLDHGQPSWHSVFDLDVEYRAPVGVTLAVEGYVSGVLTFLDEYALLASVEKTKVNVALLARKATHWKYRFSAVQPFWLYREGSSVQVVPWGGGTPQRVQPFGNDDLDRNRAMGNASGIAATPNSGRQG